LQLEARGKDMDLQMQELKIIQEQIKAETQNKKMQEGDKKEPSKT